MRKTFAALLAVTAILTLALPAAALPECTCSYCETHEFDQCWSRPQGSTTFCFAFLENYCGWQPFTELEDYGEKLVDAGCDAAPVLPAAVAVDPELDRFLATLAAG